MRKSRKGFTLIELMVVVGIIGLLSSVILVAVASGRSRARDGRRKADVKQVQGAIELYANAHNGTYPNTGGAVQCTEGAALGILVTENILPIVPKELVVRPPDGDCYKYRSDGLEYKISTLMENLPDSDSSSDGSTAPGQENRFELYTVRAKSWQLW